MSKSSHLPLRRLFFTWLVMFSVLPLAVIAFLFSYEFKSAVQIEIYERLLLYSKQLQDLFDDYEQYSVDSLDTIFTDKGLVKGIYSGTQLNKKAFNQYLTDDFRSAIIIYENGFKQRYHFNKHPQAGQTLSRLSKNSARRLEYENQHFYAYFYRPKKDYNLHLSAVKKRTLADRTLVEHVIMVNKEALLQIKKDYGFDVIFFGPKGQPLISTLTLGKGSRKELSRHFLKGNNHYFNLDLKGHEYGFISSGVSWRDHKFLIAVGSSKKNLMKSLNRFRSILIIALLLLFVGIILFVFMFTDKIIDPINSLLISLKKLKETGEFVRVKHSGRTDVDLLAQNFNEMANKLSSYQSDLERKVLALQKANQDVKSAQNQLIQTEKLAGLGQLVAGVAHELNNPIGFIYSNIGHLREYADSLMSLVEELKKEHKHAAQYLESHDYEFIKQDLPKLISSCEEGARRTRDIVTGLRNFSRASDSEDQVFSIRDCLESTLSLLRNRIKNQKIKLESKFPEETSYVCGNQNQLSQVFMNLIANAVDALGEGGTIGLSISKLEGSKITIRIKDNGSGIEPNLLDKIFDPFFTTKPVGEGTGLGLSISYGIIQKHNGEIKVRSIMGQGTEFTIILPSVVSK